MTAPWPRTLAALVLGASFALAWAAGPEPDAEPPARAGRLAGVEGAVSVYDVEQGQWIEGQRNRALTSGDRVSTAASARAEVRVGSTELRLGGGSELEFVRMDEERMVFLLHAGRLALRVRSAEIAREVEVQTAEARWAPERAGHYRIDRQDEASAGSAWRGSLRAHTRTASLQVGQGQRLEVTLQSPDGNPAITWSTPAVDEFADWVARDEQRDERSAALRYVSPEMTGVEDLDRHGRWELHPEYGMVWTPFAVAPGWAPYRYGRWYWHARWGWTWMDDAPWGFAPFHYGRWVWWGGRWAWWPGANVPRPVFAPALVAWVGGPSVSFSFSIATGPLVGWVPLAPFDPFVPWFAYGPRYYERVNRPYRPPPGHPGHRPGPPKPPPAPVMYGNKGVPGAVTVVPSNVLQARQPVQSAAVEDAVARRAVSEYGLRGGEAPVRPARPAPRTGVGAGAAVGGVAGEPGASLSPARPAPSVQAAPPVVDLRRERPGVPPSRPAGPSAPGAPAMQSMPSMPSTPGAHATPATPAAPAAPAAPLGPGPRAAPPAGAAPLTLTTTPPLPPAALSAPAAPPPMAPRPPAPRTDARPAPPAPARPAPATPAAAPPPASPMPAPAAAPPRMEPKPPPKAEPVMPVAPREPADSRGGPRERQSTQ